MIYTYIYIYLSITSYLFLLRLDLVRMVHLQLRCHQLGDAISWQQHHGSNTMVLWLSSLVSSQRRSICEFYSFTSCPPPTLPSTGENTSVAFEHVQEQSILNSPAPLQPIRVDELEPPPAFRAYQQITGFSPKMAPSANSVPVQDSITLSQDGI